MTADGSLPLPVQGYSHLRLARAGSPGQRQGRRGFGGTVRHSDRAQHAQEVRELTVTVIDDFKRRPNTLGVDPQLVVVLEANRSIDPADVESAGLKVLEIRGNSTLVAFSSDIEMTSFLNQNDEYSTGSPGLTEAGNEKAAAHQGLFDALEVVRSLAAEDVVSDRVKRRIEESDPHDLLRLDIQCWCPEDEVDARRRHNEVAAAIESSGGLVHDKMFRVLAGVSVLCADVEAGSVLALANTDRVRRIDTLPQPVLAYTEFFGARPEDLPTVVPPKTDSPIIGIVDSGVRSAHPLLAPAVLGVEFVDSSLGDGADEHGHGTLVASLALYGSLEGRLSPGISIQPAGKLVSVRVLDANNLFPADRVWEEQVLDALTLAADAGASVINLSVGDARNPYVPPRPTSLAALIDQFVRARKIVVVISSGNYLEILHEVDALAGGDYPMSLLVNDNAGLADPASAALALTVGAICSDTAQGAEERRADVNRVPVGAEGMPSPYTRVGPGVAKMVKPEVSAPGGSLSVDTLANRPVTNDRRVQIVGAGGESFDRLLAASSGTSFAAPLVANAALRLIGKYPKLTANAVRAILLSSVTESDRVVDLGKMAKSLEAQRRLTGYGRLDVERAVSSTSHRVVMLGEAAIKVDDVHIYSVPMPSSFFESGGVRTIGMALAYDPPVRPTRLDYLANRMSVNLFYRASQELVLSEYVKNPPVADDSSTDGEDGEVPRALASYRLPLLPSDTARSRGTNHFGRIVRKTRYDRSEGEEIVVAVRSTNRWDTPGSKQDYALVVTLERDDEHSPLYAEARAHLPALLEVEVEAEV